MRLGGGAALWREKRECVMLPGCNCRRAYNGDTRKKQQHPPVQKFSRDHKRKSDGKKMQWYMRTWGDVITSKADAITAAFLQIQKRVRKIDDIAFG